MVKRLPINAGDLGLIPGLGRFPGEGNGNPLQYSCLENPMDGGPWCRLLSMGSQRVGHDWTISLHSQNVHVCVCACMLSCFSCVQLFAILWTVACQAPLSMGFSRQETWSGLPFTSAPVPVPLQSINKCITIAFVLVCFLYLEDKFWAQAGFILNILLHCTQQCFKRVCQHNELMVCSNRIKQVSGETKCNIQLGVGTEMRCLRSQAFRMGVFFFF